jgi:hypothetical protein
VTRKRAEEYRRLKEECLIAARTVSEMAQAQALTRQLQ